jgi:heme O synthase-like polyprenyltransferase
MDEAISPELALVCPELRLKAIAALPEHDWDAVLARVRIRPLSGGAATRARGQLVPDLLMPLAVAVIFFVSATLGTLVLTLIADSLR